MPVPVGVKVARYVYECSSPVVVCILFLMCAPSIGGDDGPSQREVSVEGEHSVCRCVCLCDSFSCA